MANVEKNFKKQSIFPTDLGSLPKSLEESLDYNRTGKERTAQVIQERIEALERGIKAQEIKEDYADLRKTVVRNLFRTTDIAQATKQAFLVLILSVSFSACKAIDTAHRNLEYREAQSYLEWQRSDERKPATLPYWKVDLEKTLSVVEPHSGTDANGLKQKGGQEK